MTNFRYPSGNQINYRYDAAGRISAITLNPVSANGFSSSTTVTTLLGAIKYTPTGQFLSGTFGNHTSTVPSTLSRTYDLDGRVPGSTLACNRSDMLKVYFFFFGDDTYLPFKIKDLKYKPDGFLMYKDEFSQLILNSKPAKEDWFENITMRAKAKDGEYFINQDGAIYFNKSVIGQLDKEVLNSLDFGFGLYEPKTCSPSMFE